MTTTLKSLRAEANALTGRNTRKMEREELEKLIATHNATEARMAARRTEEELIKADRAFRAEFRAKPEWSTTRHEDDEAQIHWIYRRMMSWKETFATEQAKFLKGIESDAFYALEWAQTFAEATAKNKVATDILRGIELGCSLHDLKSDVTDKVMSGARYPASSTSSMSNLMTTLTTAAMAQVMTW